MKRLLCTLLLFFAFFTLTQTAHAQEFLYSIAHVEQFGNPPDPNAVMAGYSVTGMTYGLALWYNAIQVSTLYQDSTIVDQQVSENYPATVNYTQAALVPGSIYTQYTDTGTHVIDFTLCGNPFDAYGLSNYAYLPYEDDHQWNPFPSICIIEQFLYLGYTVEQTQASQPNQPCVETCEPCKRDRRNRILICAGAFTVCELGFYQAYRNQLLTCDNNDFCRTSSPTFDRQKCDNCKQMAENTFIAQASTCAGGAALACFLTLPDCSLKDKCVNGMKMPCN
jgi:hypothetical protein